MSEVPRPLPGFAAWPTFPFEGDLRVKKLDDPVPVEPPRHGEDPSECRACQAPDQAYIWVSDRWRVRSLDRPTGLPMVLILESRSHLDLGDLPNMLAAELGVMTVRLERAVRSLDGVARVHVNRWGDGSAHLHLWFLARPHGRLQLRGTFLSLWDEILPPIPEQQWRENLALVAAWLAEFGGTPLAEPPRIDWKSPATLAPVAQGGPESAGSATASGVPMSNVEAAVSAPETIADHGGTEGTPSGSTAVSEPAGVPGSAGTASAAAPGGDEAVSAAGGGQAATAPGGDETGSAPAVPGQSTGRDEIRVKPGPSGFPPIGERAIRQSAKPTDTAGPVPGQRDGSTDSRDPAAPTPA